MTPRPAVRSGRALLLACASFAIAIPTLLACFGTEIVGDRLDFPVMVVVATGIGYPYAQLFLARSRLAWSLPLAGAFTIAAIATGFHTLGMLGVLPAFAASVAAMALLGNALRDPLAPAFADSWPTTLTVAAAVLAMAVLGSVCFVGAYLMAAAGC